MNLAFKKLHSNDDLWEQIELCFWVKFHSTLNSLEAQMCLPFKLIWSALRSASVLKEMSTFANAWFVFATNSGKDSLREKCKELWPGRLTCFLFGTRMAAARDSRLARGQVHRWAPWQTVHRWALEFVSLLQAENCQARRRDSAMTRSTRINQCEFNSLAAIHVQLEAEQNFVCTGDCRYSLTSEGCIGWAVLSICLASRLQSQILMSLAVQRSRLLRGQVSKMFLMSLVPSCYTEDDHRCEG